jgi:hypothetical protein
MKCLTPCSRAISKIRIPQYISAFSPIAKPFRFTNAMSMLVRAEWRSVSLYPSPGIMVTLGRAASSRADEEFVERVRT